MQQVRFRFRSQRGVPLILLFFLLFLLLDLFTHPISVLSSTDYVPLVIRISDVYFWQNGLIMRLSEFGVPLLLIALMLFMCCQRFSFRRALLVLLAPFLVALVIQYFIAVQLDKYLQFPRLGQPILWRHVFQVSFMLHCGRIVLIYAVVVSALYA